MNTSLAVAACSLGVLLAACAGPQRPMEELGRGDEARLSALLDEFHRAASRADFAGYFACFADDAVFLGTDASERWTVEQFKEYCRPYFEKGKGWTYVPRARHISFLAGTRGGASDIAYFDELLDNEKYGTCRGSGVVRRVSGNGTAGAWKIAQYNLAFMVPNDAAVEVTAITKRFDGNGK